MPPLQLCDRATPYTLRPTAWAVSKEGTAATLAGADSISPAKAAALLLDGEQQPADEWELAAGRPQQTSDGSLTAWGDAPPAGLAALRAVADAPPGVSPALAAVLVALEAASIPTPAAIPAAARAAIAARGLDSTFFVYDLGALHRLFTAWTAAFGPALVPHFAVKANPDPGLLRVLAVLGAGFDCASRAEICLVQGLGVPAHRIIYAHPCKPPAELRFACARGVAHTTFDNAGEVTKLARWHPGARALLRIRADDPTARFCLGSKYGCEVGDAPGLLATAKAAGVAVVGVAFHVGSGACDPAAYGRAIAAAAVVFEAGAAAGHEMGILDLGGGFAGGDSAAPDAGLGPVAAAVRTALETHFPPARGICVIAEPGRFFAEPVGTLAVAINGVRLHASKAPAPATLAPTTTRDAVDYFLSDGVYGSFNSIIYDDARLAFLPLCSGGGGGGAEEGEDSPATTALPSTLYGPTCDSADIVARGVRLPRLGVGDFLLCPRASAYSIAGASNFNGFQATKAGAAYVYSAGE